MIWKNIKELEKKYTKKIFLIKDKEIVANFETIDEAELYLKEKDKDNLISLQTKDDLNLNNQNYFINIGLNYGK